jgi:hypothetical protein
VVLGAPALAPISTPQLPFTLIPEHAINSDRLTLLVYLHDVLVQICTFRERWVWWGCEQRDVDMLDLGGLGDCTLLGLWYGVCLLVRSLFPLLILSSLFFCLPPLSADGPPSRSPLPSEALSFCWYSLLVLTPLDLAFSR